MNDPKKETIDLESEGPRPSRRGSPAEELGLALAWSAEEPDRLGELLFPLDPISVFGRFDADEPASDAPFLCPVRQRPGAEEAVPPFALPLSVSRRQIEFLRLGPGGLEVRRRGKAAVVLNGHRELAPGQSERVRSGDTIRIGTDLILLAVERPRKLPPLRFLPDEEIPAFGTADRFGIVGESVAAWQLRDRVAFAAKLDQHVLVTGDTGTGKELAARAIHGLSPRSQRPLVAHSMADMPESIIEAELFGNLKDYPNPGTPGRSGLLGSAHDSTLFLDEIGAVPVSVQARLLRVLDEDGAYRRLGDDQPQRSDIRLVAATNSSPATLKFDLLARLKISVNLPPLVDRIEDVPLLLRHLLSTKIAVGEASPTQVSVTFMEALLRHTYPANVRELESLLLAALYQSSGPEIELSAEVEARLVPRDEPSGIDPAAVPWEDIESVLVAHDWNVARSARQLGWSRDQLNRAIRKHEKVRPRRPDGGG